MNQNPIQMFLYACLAYGYLRIGQEVVAGLGDSSLGSSFFHLIALVIGAHGVLLWRRSELTQRPLDSQIVLFAAVVICLGFLSDLAVMVLGMGTA